MEEDASSTRAAGLRARGDSTGGLETGALYCTPDYKRSVHRRCDPLEIDASYG